MPTPPAFATGFAFVITSAKPSARGTAATFFIRTTIGLPQRDTPAGHPERGNDRYQDNRDDIDEVLNGRLERERGAEH